ncbi:low affinity immunoglobulin gamma Fc region receptor III-like isoform 2-T2 [Menidia menidia]
MAAAAITTAALCIALSCAVVLEAPEGPVMLGEAVTLFCRSPDHDPSNATTEFYKDGVLVHSSQTGAMSIPRAATADSGRYECSVPGAGRSPGRLLIVSSGVVLEVLPEVVVEGDSVTLRCRSRNDSSPRIADFFQHGVRVATGYGGELRLPRAARGHQGAYRCSISGLGESEERRLTVRPAGGPAPPGSPPPPGWSLHILLPALLGVLLLAGLLLVAVLCSRRPRPAAEAPPTTGPQGESSQVIYAKVSHHRTRAGGKPGPPGESSQGIYAKVSHHRTKAGDGKAPTQTVPAGGNNPVYSTINFT